MGRLLGGLLVLVGLVAIVGVAGYFVLKRPDIPYETLAAKYESPASRYVDLANGVHVHYRDEGQQPIDGGQVPTVLLVHGYSASLQTWEQWVPRLGDDFRVVSLDLPGHGLTRAPAGYHASIEGYRDLVAEFAGAIGLERFAIVGSSMGGNVAWEYALAHPEQLDALVLVDASGWPDTNADARNDPPIFALLRNPVTAGVLRDLDNTSLIRQGLEASFADPAKVDDAMVARYTEMSRAPGHREILVQLMLDYRARNDATAERLSAIAVPTLIMQGAHDNLIPPAHAQQFKDAIPGAELVMFENSGHIPQEELPEESANAAWDFLYRAVEGSALAPEEALPAEVVPAE